MNHYPWELIALLCLGFILYACMMLVKKKKRMQLEVTENYPFISKAQTTQIKWKETPQGRWLRNHC